MLLITIFIVAVNTLLSGRLPERVTLTVLAGILYLCLFLVFGIDRINKRRSRDTLQAEIVRELFSQINKEIFDDNSGVRITLFRRSPISPSHIVPWYRFGKGVVDPIGEAQRSKVQYGRGEGYTGYAWATAGRSLLCASLPKFTSREEFEQYYTNTLGINPKTVRDISDYMVGIRTIFSYGFLDANGEFLGVLSLDLPAPVESEDAPDAAALMAILRSIGRVLESFKRAERK